MGHCRAQSRLTSPSSGRNAPADGAACCALGVRQTGWSGFPDLRTGTIVGKPDNSGIMRAVRAARFSAQGFVHTWRHESALRQELTLGMILTALGMWLGQTAYERILLIACLLQVLIVEPLNSAVEAAIDRFGDEHHELSGCAKDLGSAAGSVSLALVVLVWSTVAWGRFGG